MQKITPFLWFDNQAEEAVNFYVMFSRIQRLAASLVMATPVRARKELSCPQPSSYKAKNFSR